MEQRKLAWFIPRRSLVRTQVSPQSTMAKKSDGASKRRGGRPPKTPPDPVVAEILVFADKETTAAAAAKYGVADRTIRRWRARIEAGQWPQLADLVRQVKAAAIERCQDLLADVYETSLRLLKEKMPQATYRELLETAIETGGLKQLREDLGDGSSAGAGAHHGGKAAAGSGSGAPGGAGVEKALRVIR